VQGFAALALQRLECPAGHRQVIAEVLHKHKAANVAERLRRNHCRRAADLLPSRP